MTAINTGNKEGKCVFVRGGEREEKKMIINDKSFIRHHYTSHQKKR
jgi:hypothetical protein